MNYIYSYPPATHHWQPLPALFLPSYTPSCGPQTVMSWQGQRQKVTAGPGSSKYCVYFTVREAGSATQSLPPQSQTWPLTSVCGKSSTLCLNFLIAKMDITVVLTAPAQGNQSLSRELRASALCPGLEAQFPARRREDLLPS